MTSRRRFVRTAAFGAAALTLPHPLLAGPKRRPLRPGDFMMIDVPGTALDADTTAFIREYGIRGVCLFQRHITSEAQARGLIGSLRAVIGPDALIAVDQEGGGVIRTRTLPFPPSAMSLGAANDTALAERVGAATGRGLRSLGFNWNFAPDLDVNNNPDNPVIGDRSFGSDPALVERIGLAWMAGLTAAGVAGCVKHFPGHGDTQVDSHLGLPVVDKDAATLEALEFAPFRRAAEANAPAFMTAHIVFPALDAEHPATLSRPILTGLLRERFGYDGVITTDAMGMKAITDKYGRGEAGRLALAAGADLVMALGTRAEQLETADAIARTLRESPASDLRAKTARLSALAARFPVEVRPYADAERAADGALMREAWAAGLTVVRGARPITPGSALTLVVPQAAAGGAAADAGLSGASLVARLSGLYDLRVHTFDPQSDPNATLPDFARVHRAGTPVVFASTSRLRIGAPLKAFVAAIRPTLHLALWNAYNVLDVDAPALVTYGFRPEALDAVVAWMQGRAQANGTLPIALT